MRFLSFTTLFLMVFYGFSQKNDTIYKAGNILYVQQKTFENGELLVVLKDRLGLTIAKGAYKDYEKYEGKFYNANNKHIEKYKNGKIVGKITRNKYTNETYECSYEDYSPIDGDYFSINTLDTYKNKKRIKSIKFDYETGNILSVTFFENVDYEKIVKKVFYKNDEESILHYKDGIPFAGKELTNYGYITFKNGEYNGPFLINDKRVIISGNYRNFNMHGPIKYIPASTRDTLICTFKNGKPINGTSFEAYNLINYKNGKKEGCGYKTYNNRRYPYDSLAICYKNDLPIGKATYYLKKKVVTETDYKNGKPYSGSVFNFANLTTYSNGDIVEIDTIIEYKNRQKRYYKNNTKNLRWSF